MSTTQAEMSNPQLVLTINDFTVQTNDILNFEFLTRQSSVLPQCKFLISDMLGTYLAQFYGFAIGSKINIKIVDVGLNKSIEYSPMVVSAITEVEADMSSMGGCLSVLCSHPWEFYKNYSSHAYLGQQNSEIIKGLIKDSSSRGCEIAFNDKYFDSSDDNGAIPRYKCSMSDYDFIMDNLIPYTTLNNCPPLFWIDEFNTAHLKSFNSCFNETSVCLGLPSNGADSSIVDQNIEKIKKLYTSNGSAAFLFSSALVQVGDEKPGIFLKTLNSEVMLENNQSNRVYTGTMAPKIAIQKYDASSKVDQSRIPVSLEAMSNAGATDFKDFINMNLADATALAVNMQSPFYSFFRMEITGQFGGDFLRTGDNIYVFVAATNQDTKGQVHWISNKWNIEGTKYFIDSNNRDAGLQATLILQRPSFMFNTDNTTLAGTDLLYAVAI